MVFFRMTDTYKDCMQRPRYDTPEVPPPAAGPERVQESAPRAETPEEGEI